LGEIPEDSRSLGSHETFATWQPWGNCSKFGKLLVTFLMKLLSLASISTFVSSAILYAGVSQAALRITATDTSAGVLFSGLGNVNLSGLTFDGYRSDLNYFNSAIPVFQVGPAGYGDSHKYYCPPPGCIAEATVPGVLYTIPATSGAGDGFGYFGGGYSGVVVPEGYVSGSSLTGSSLFSGQTLASMGLVEGTYAFNWGSGPTGDSITFEVGVPPVPAPLPLLGAASALAWSRRLRQRIQVD